MLDCSFECRKERKIHTICWKTVPHVDDTNSKVRGSDIIATMLPIQFIGMTSSLDCTAKLEDLWYTDVDTPKYNAVTHI